uniref:RAP domain-containing protein n=1 Tax=Steinernema glaseri TaxID=37863 RepID=A0A1I8A960_9BILA
MCDGLAALCLSFCNSTTVMSLKIPSSGDECKVAMQRLGVTLRTLVSVRFPLVATSSFSQGRTYCAERHAANAVKEKPNFNNFIDDVLSNCNDSKPSISRTIFETDNVASFRKCMQRETMRTDEDVMSILGHLISLSNGEPYEVAAWVEESNFPSVLASHTLKDDVPPANIFRALVSLYVLGYGHVARQSDQQAISILHSFDTLLPELLKRMEVILTGDVRQIPITHVIQFIAVLNRLNVSLNDHMKGLLIKAIQANVGSLSSPGDVITILRNLDLEKQQGLFKEQVLAKATELVPVMNNGELVSIMKFLSEKTKRDMMLLPLLANALSKSFEPLTVNQILTLTYAAANLSFRDAALMRRISEEIQVNVGSFTNWKDMMILMGSLNRLGIGDLPIWRSLIKWMTTNITDAPYKNLIMCLTSCGMANVPSHELKELGHRVAARLAPTAKESPIHWLNAVYALTLVGSLKHNIAEKMLRKEFVAEITNLKGLSPGSELLYKIKIAQINAATKYDLRKYVGSRLNMIDILDANVKVEDVSHVKQSKRGNVDFNNILLFLASANHMSRPMLTEDSLLVDAFAEVDGDGIFVSVKDWDRWLKANNLQKGHRRLAFVYVAYNHTLRDTAPGSEGKLRPTGDIAMDIRHLEANGFTPVVFYEQELPYFVELADKIKFVKERLTDALK